jgi:SAM-dependent methyltransferase/uncharacterized protein YbaR (Trm112 family)
MTSGVEQPRVSMNEVPSSDLIELLACPRDHSSLAVHDNALACEQGHRFPLVNGIPVMVLPDQLQTHDVAGLTIRDAYFPEFRNEQPTTATRQVDQFVQDSIVLVAGQLYSPIKGRLTRYPVANLELPPGEGRLFLDIGSSWGRWSIAAARLGYRVLGIDPNLEAIRAARRICASERVEADFVVGDARFLPIRSGIIDLAFSYSVLQHFAPSDVRLALREIRRVLATEGLSRIQMANAAGIRNFYQQARRKFRPTSGFDVRYWPVSQLLETFSDAIGPSSVTPEGFLGLGVQPKDRDLHPAAYRGVISFSESLRKLARVIPALADLADSLYVTSVVESNHAHGAVPPSSVR